MTNDHLNDDRPDPPRWGVSDLSGRGGTVYGPNGEQITYGHNYVVGDVHHYGRDTSSTDHRERAATAREPARPTAGSTDRDDHVHGQICHHATATGAARDGTDHRDRQAQDGGAAARAGAAQARAFAAQARADAAQARAQARAEWAPTDTDRAVARAVRQFERAARQAERSARRRADRASDTDYDY